ncbi:MAG: hypothetical protein IJY46_03220, partial [Lentisphaeria bacterium]|nr:hypothetical protein [Lentisphaeria bacterium]
SIFFSGRKLELEKVILSDFVLREQNARAHAPRHQWSCVQNGLFATGGNIATLSGDFAREKRGECTTVLDPSGERRKVRGSKRDCRRRSFPPDGYDILHKK